jgi:hypothetical protein
MVLGVIARAIIAEMITPNMKFQIKVDMQEYFAKLSSILSNISVTLDGNDANSGAE